MYRVELKDKVKEAFRALGIELKFLMYRVELKALL